MPIFPRQDRVRNTRWSKYWSVIIREFLRNISNQSYKLNKSRRLSLETYVTFWKEFLRISPMVWMYSHCCFVTGVPTFSTFICTSSNSHWKTNKGTARQIKINSTDSTDLSADYSSKAAVHSSEKKIFLIARRVFSKQWKKIIDSSWWRIFRVSYFNLEICNRISTVSINNHKWTHQIMLDKFDNQWNISTTLADTSCDKCAESDFSTLETLVWLLGPALQYRNSKWKGADLETILSQWYPAVSPLQRRTWSTAFEPVPNSTLHQRRLRCVIRNIKYQYLFVCNVSFNFPFAIQWKNYFL